MAYCVHCGVKLGAGEKRCPLCHTVSIDPHESKTDAPQPLYPIHTPQQLMTRSKRYFLILFGILLLVPALLCLVIDLLIGGGITWSIYAQLRAPGSEVMGNDNNRVPLLSNCGSL